MAIIIDYCAPTATRPQRIKVACTLTGSFRVYNYQHDFDDCANVQHAIKRFLSVPKITRFDFIGV